MGSEDLLKKRGRIKQDFQVTTDYLKKGSIEAERIANELKCTRATLDNLDEQFCKATGLTKTDAKFLFVAIGLQIVRQYVFSNDKFRISHSQGDRMMSNALSIAPPSWKNVLLQSVPYDAFATSSHVSDTGLSGSTHRYRTLGHDPMLGWISGTANIMTNSLTKTDLETYQVNMQTFTLVRRYPFGVAGMFEKAVEYGTNDPKLLAAAVARQAIHLGSDYFTKQGLPVPVIATVNNDLAKNMITKWNIDAYSITRGASLSVFINTLISLIHGLFFSGESDMDKKLYEVRTRKILLYSNLVATSSNIAVVALTKDLKKLDVGGMAVTIYRLITDVKFIKQVKEEFIFGNYRELIEGDKEYLYIE